MGGVIGLNLVAGGVIRLNNNCLPGNGRCHRVEPIGTPTVLNLMVEQSWAKGRVSMVV